MKSGRALDVPPLKAAESEQIITSLGMVSSIHLKAHRIAINSDEQSSQSSPQAAPHTPQTQLS